jgi:low affinity Fe/Cu permease
MPNGKASGFTRMASWTAHMAGRPAVFALAVAIIVGWALVGPAFGFSDTWQLVINTTTTIVTFLMVFLIQNTQNRDGQAIQIKLDELIRAMEGAHNQLLDLEEMDEADLVRIRERYEKLAQDARNLLKRGEADVEVADLAPQEAEDVADAADEAPRRQPKRAQKKKPGRTRRQPSRR